MYKYIICVLLSFPIRFKDGMGFSTDLFFFVLLQCLDSFHTSTVLNDFHHFFSIFKKQNRFQTIQQNFQNFSLHIQCTTKLLNHPLINQVLHLCIIGSSQCVCKNVINFLFHFRCFVVSRGQHEK